MLRLVAPGWAEQHGGSGGGGPKGGAAGSNWFSVCLPDLHLNPTGQGGQTSPDNLPAHPRRRSGFPPVTNKVLSYL